MWKKRLFRERGFPRNILVYVRMKIDCSAWLVVKSVFYYGLYPLENESRRFQIPPI